MEQTTPGSGREADRLRPQAPARPGLAYDTVDVWRVALDQPPAIMRGLDRLLSRTERDRIAHARHARDRQRRTVARAALRAILADRLGCAPDTVPIAAGPHGKPQLDREPRLQFNLTRVEGECLVAVARSAPVGIDLERIVALDDVAGLAARLMSAAEAAQWRALGRPPDLFFRCWTRKEAYAKACGLGLSLALDRLTVCLAPDEPAAFIAMPDDPSAWSLLDLPVGADHVAALAVRRPRVATAMRRWQPEAAALAPSLRAAG